tara:strand:+ start:2970 stop:3917 length:948 start_codon:yes stop_codon:yes gene_type:complete
MSVAYINYHRKPRVQFLSISEYNQEFGTNLEENKEFENEFKTAWMAARYETDPNDYIQHSFGETHVVGDSLAAGIAGIVGKAANISGRKFTKKRENYKAGAELLGRSAQVGAQGVVGAAKLGAEGVKGLGKGIVKLGSRVKDKLQSAMDKQRQQDAKGDGSLPLQEAAEEESEEKIDFLDDYAEENEIQEESQDLTEATEENEEMEAIEEEEMSLSDQIDSFLADNAKDSQQFSRDRSHVVHFNTDTEDLSGRLMKGRDRYMKRLQQYADGDTSVKVRMMNNKEVLVSSLKPNISSLRDLLATPHGEPRFCMCDC